MPGRRSIHRPVYLTPSPSYQVIYEDIARSGLCCDYALPRRCVSFNMMLHPDAVSLSVESGRVMAHGNQHLLMPVIGRLIVNQPYSTEMSFALVAKTFSL